MSDLSITLPAAPMGFKVNSKSDPKVLFPNSDELFQNTKNSIEQKFNARIAELEKELEKTREESFQAGFEKGRDVTLSDTEKQIAHISQENKDMINVLAVEYNKSIETIEEPLLNLAMGVARKILDRELKYTEDYNEHLINQLQIVLAEIINKSAITIHINPKQYDSLINYELKDKIGIPEKVDINFIQNQHLQPGECILETKDYLVENIISNQLEHLKKQLYISNT